MLTLALRFAETFAPPNGTIDAHRQIIDVQGYVWYGKLGLPVSAKVCEQLLNEDNPRILLIHSGGINRYWAYISEITREMPRSGEYPKYYGEKADLMKTWFKVLCFEDAPKNVMGLCKLRSSGAVLSEVSKHSMSPYFIVEYNEK